MAMVVSNTASYLTLASGLASSTCAFSFWCKVTTWPGGSGSTFGSYGFTGTPPSPTNGLGAENDTAIGPRMLYGNVVPGPEPQLGTGDVSASFVGWQFFFFAVDATGVLKAYYCLQGANPTLLLTTSAANIGTLGNFYCFSPFFNAQAKLASVKLWTGAGATFTLQQVIAESQSQAPVITSNIKSYLSGNNPGTAGVAQQGSNWTVTGTITFDGDQPSYSGNNNAILFASDI